MHNVSVFSPDTRLFVSELRGKVLLGFDGTDIPSYATTYLDAADVLLDRASVDVFGMFLLFPALYCYRHAAEITLKEIIYAWDRMQRGTWKVWKTHDLTILWPEARSAVDAIRPNMDQGSREAVGSLVQELMSVDPDGWQLRYAIDRRGRSAPLPPEFAGVDLDNLRATMRQLMAFLLGIRADLEDEACLRAAGE